MPLIETQVGIGLLITYTRVKGYEVDDWWRDEDALELLWDLQGYGHDTCVGVPSGDLHAWVTCQPNKAGDALNFWVLAFGKPPIEGKLEYNWLDIRQPGTQKAFPVDFITRAKMGDGDRPQDGGFEPGHRIGTVVRATRQVQLALVASVDAEGRPLAVQLGPGATPRSAADCGGRRWFSIQGRALGFDWFFEREKTTFAGYLNMRGVLAQKDKKLRKLEGLPEEHVQNPRSQAPLAKMQLAHLSRDKTKTYDVEISNLASETQFAFNVLVSLGTMSLDEITRHVKTEKERKISILKERYGIL